MCDDVLVECVSTSLTYSQTRQKSATEKLCLWFFATTKDHRRGAGKSLGQNSPTLDCTRTGISTQSLDMPKRKTSKGSPKACEVEAKKKNKSQEENFEDPVDDEDDEEIPSEAAHDEDDYEVILIGAGPAGIGLGLALLSGYMDAS